MIFKPFIILLMIIIFLGLLICLMPQRGFSFSVLEARGAAGNFLFVEQNRREPVDTGLTAAPLIGIVTAYTADPAETDDSPDITASGQKVRVGIIANNKHPFGTKVEIGGKIYEIQDRMNKKYDGSYWDIFMEDKAEALRFGRRKMEVKIVR